MKEVDIGVCPEWYLSLKYAENTERAFCLVNRRNRHHDILGIRFALKVAYTSDYVWGEQWPVKGTGDTSAYYLDFWMIWGKKLSWKHFFSLMSANT